MCMHSSPGHVIGGRGHDVLNACLLHLVLILQDSFYSPDCTTLVNRSARISAISLGVTDRICVDKWDACSVSEE